MAGGYTVRNVSKVNLKVAVVIALASLVVTSQFNATDAQTKKVRPNTPPTLGERLSRKSLQYLKENEIAKALSYANEAIKLAPKEGMPYYARARIYHEKKRDELALVDISKCIEYTPRNADAYVLRARIMIRLDRVDENALEADLLKAKSIDPDTEDLYDGLGILYAVQKKFDKAAEALSEAIKRHPTEKKLYIHRSMTYSVLKQYDKAIADCTMCIKISPQDPEAYVRRGTAYELVGKNDLAIADYSTAIKLAPRDPRTLKTRASLFSKMRKPEDAIKDYTLLLNLNPYDDDFLLLRGNEYRKLKQYQKAVDDYSEAISLSPEFARPSYVARAEVYGLMGKKELADRDRAKVHEMDKAPAERKL